MDVIQVHAESRFTAERLLIILLVESILIQSSKNKLPDVVLKSLPKDKRCNEIFVPPFPEKGAEG